MTSRDAMELIVEPMMKVCRQPSGTDAAALAETYAAALERFSRHSLRVAWQRLSVSHAGKFWPPLEDVVNACALAPAEHRNANSGAGESLASYTFRRAKEIAAAYESGHADLYRRGEAEGWRMDLDCAVRDAAHVVAQAEYLGSVKRKYPNVATDPYRIVVTQAEADVWRKRVACRPQGTGIGRRFLKQAVAAE